jgi:hypothetical protein
MLKSVEFPIQTNTTIKIIKTAEFNTPLKSSESSGVEV